MADSGATHASLLHVGLYLCTHHLTASLYAHWPICTTPLLAHMAKKALLLFKCIHLGLSCRVSVRAPLSFI